MSQSFPALVTLHIDETEHEQARDRMARQLLRDLRSSGLRLESAELKRDTENNQGAMAVDPITIGVVALALAPQAIGPLIEFLREIWIHRQSELQIEFEYGGAKMTYTLNNVPLAELQESLTAIGLVVSPPSATSGASDQSSSK
jgi:hypothetical protein